MRGLVLTTIILGLIAFTPLSFAYGPGGGESEYQEVKLSIAGMTCDACPAIVKTALLKIGGVAIVDVDLQTGIARVQMYPGVELNSLLEAVKAAGFEAEVLTPALPEMQESY